MHDAAVTHDPGAGAASRRAVGPVAIAAVALAGLLSAIGTYADSEGDQGTREFLIVCAIIAVGAALVFGWVVPKMLERSSTATPALVLAGLGLVTVVVFWSGLPPILAAGAGLLGWSGRNAARGAGRCRTALAIAVVAVIADVAITLSDLL